MGWYFLDTGDTVSYVMYPAISRVASLLYSHAHTTFLSNKVKIFGFYISSNLSESNNID